MMKQPRSPTDIAFDRHLSPVNRSAARVIARGEHWDPKKKIETADSPNPLLYAAPDAASHVTAGHCFGSLVVLGRATDPLLKKGKGGSAYVCRCTCGYYTIRRAKAVLNPANDKDACDRCRQKQYLNRKDEYIQHGRNR